MHDRAESAPDLVEPCPHASSLRQRGVAHVSNADQEILARPLDVLQDVHILLRSVHYDYSSRVSLVVPQGVQEDAEVHRVRMGEIDMYRIDRCDFVKLVNLALKPLLNHPCNKITHPLNFTPDDQEVRP